MYEMMLSIQVLIKENGLSLLDPSWDLVLSIIEAIITHLGNFLKKKNLHYSVNFSLVF